MKTDKTKTKKSKKSSEPTSNKKAKRAERLAKKEARKGDGSFPDLIIVTKAKTDKGKSYFAAHDGEKMDTLYDNDETVAVYKLRRVSKMVISRKVAR